MRPCGNSILLHLMSGRRTQLFTLLSVFWQVVLTTGLTGCASRTEPLTPPKLQTASAATDESTSDEKSGPTEATPKKPAPNRDSLQGAVRRPRGASETAEETDAPTYKNGDTDVEVSEDTDAPRGAGEIAKSREKLPKSNPRSDGVSTSSSSTGTGSRKIKPIPDAAKTVKNVQDILEKSKQAKEQKDYGTAFHLATKAWEATQLHPDDPHLKSVAQQLASELDELGGLSNKKYSDKVSSPATTLIDK